MSIQDLSNQNPWWREKEEIQKDPLILALENAPLKWIPRLKHFVEKNLEVSGICSIRGPRQVGKTTLVKLLIKEKIERGANPYSICYFTCDNLKNFNHLQKTIEDYKAFVSTFIQNQRKTVFIDEISRVNEWYRTIKFFRDTYPDEFTFLVTGSHSVDLHKSLEYLAGRSGEYPTPTKHHILLPMKFAEYMEYRLPSAMEVIKKNRLNTMEERKACLEKIMRGKMPPSIVELLPHLNQIDRVFDEYLITGGVMPAVSSFLQTSRISNDVYDIYLRYVNEDTTQLRRDELWTFQILRGIIESMGSTTNWNKLTKGTDSAKTSPTIRQYVSLLQDMFIIKQIYKLDEERLIPDTRAKEKKVFISNPFFYHAIRGYMDSVQDKFNYSTNLLTNLIKKSQLVEGVVGDHLCRLTYSYTVSDTFNPSNYLFFWKNKRGHEVDYVFKMNGRLMGFEVKYKEDISNSDFRGLHSLPSKERVMITKRTFGLAPGRICEIPVSLFLLLI